MVPNDPQYSQQWAMTKIDAPDAWNITTGSQSVVVAVIDTGVDYTDSELAANIWTNPAQPPAPATTTATASSATSTATISSTNNGNPMDDNGHGTHVAGIIAAVGNNGQGVAGVDWSVSIMALKFLDSQGDRLPLRRHSGHQLRHDGAHPLRRQRPRDQQ